MGQQTHKPNLLAISQKAYLHETARLSYRARGIKDFLQRIWQGSAAHRI